MKIVIDTNVWLAAFLTHGYCAELIEHLLMYHTIISSSFIIDEVGEKLRKKFKFENKEVNRVVHFIKENSSIVIPVPFKQVCIKSDPDDDMILATAIAGNADCMISGDSDLLNLKKFQNITILKPSDFWAFEKI